MKSISIATALAILAIACTTRTTEIVDDSDKGDKDKDKKSSTSATEPEGSTGGNTGGPTTTPSPTPPTPAPTEPAEPACASTTSQQACLQCCATDHPQGAQVYTGAITTCVCEAANCGTECAATYCATQQKNPDQACATCANSKMQNCNQALTTACTASPKCMEFYGCLESSGCATKN